jgi:Domain of unknown function (DUF4384)
MTVRISLTVIAAWAVQSFLAFLAFLAVAQAGSLLCAPGYAAQSQPHLKKVGQAPAPSTPNYSHLKKVPIVRKEKKIYGQIRKKRVLAEPLSLQWWIEKQDDNGESRWVDPNSIFHEDDFIRLGVKTNQAGYLYIINHRLRSDVSTANPPHILFPDSQVNKGNYVKLNTTYFVPAYCQGLHDPLNCWLQFFPPAGKEVFTLIFSRERILDLPERITQVEATVDPALLETLKAMSSKDLEKKAIKAQAPSTRTGRRSEKVGDTNLYVTRVTNTNRADNEEVLVTIELTHQD